MDLDLCDCFGMKKPLSYNQRNTVILLHFRSSLEKDTLTLGPLTVDSKTTGNTSTPTKGAQVYKFQHWTK